ncbi:hypothetical protein [Streptomyces sp. NPDC052291]|uniref:hypothetical protein n=1 Tax=Streptomyces sp. NPDC052291 TaxID=3161011 RepID=UPI003412D087
MKPTPTMLTNSFYAFYDLHRPAYRDYAEARLAPEEAQVAVSHLFDLVASHWSTIVREPDPAAWAWERHTQTVARRSGHALTPAEEALLLYEVLRLSIDKIATVTGTEPAAVSTLLAAARRRPCVLPDCRDLGQAVGPARGPADPAPDEVRAVAPR